MAKKKDKFSVEATVSIHKIHAIADAVVRVLSEGIKWGCLVFIAYLFAPVFIALAGKETITTVNMTLLANKDFAAILGLIFGAGGIAYGNRQATLRKDVIERMHKFQLKYETGIDPSRSSSELSPRGDTPEGEE